VGGRRKFIRKTDKGRKGGGAKCRGNAKVPGVNKPGKKKSLRCKLLEPNRKSKKKRRMGRSLRCHDGISLGKRGWSLRERRGGKKDRRKKEQTLEISGGRKTLNVVVFVGTK